MLFSSQIVLGVIAASCVSSSPIAPSNVAVHLDNTQLKQSNPSLAGFLSSSISGLASSWVHRSQNNGQEAFTPLLKKLDSTYQAEDQQYFPTIVYPPLKWQKQKGLYDSNVHLNFKGKLAPIRNLYHFSDDNGFVTLNVLEALLEAQAYNVQNIPHIKDAVDAVLTHRDKNHPETIMFNFWNQELTNAPNNSESSIKKGYAAVPPNIAIPFRTVNGGLKPFIGAIEKLGVKNIPNVSAIFETAIHLFAIPPDADDTGCALAVGAQLSYLSSLASPLADISAQPAARSWFRAIGDSNAAAFDAYAKYAYRPFSDQLKENLIDSRTYFWLRKYLDLKKASGDTNVALISTWFQSIDQLKDESFYQRMPFSINNVDISVLANGLYGMTMTLLTQPEKYAAKFEGDVETVYRSSMDMLLWALAENIVEQHPATTLLYYPSRYAFYYFVSRLWRALDNKPLKPEAFPDHISNMYGEFHQRLGAILKTVTTEQLFGMAHRDEKTSSYVVWDDFLGLGDQPPRYEDRVFSTAMAATTLLNIWTDSELKNTTYVNTGETIQRYTSKWTPDTPQLIQNVITSSIQFLEKEADSYPPENAFFSASVKSTDCLPFFFPANFKGSVNGPSANLTCTSKLGGPTDIKGAPLVGVTGVMDPSEYEKMAAEGCFGKPTSKIDSTGYNCDGCIFPYWSAPSYTHAIRLLAIAKWNRLGSA